MTEPLSIEKNEGIDAFWLKVIAIVGMFSDHVGNVFGDMMPLWLKCLFFIPGGLTFPIMAYLMSEGYRHTSSFRRYVGRLLLFALVTQPIYMWAFKFWVQPIAELPAVPLLNILFTLAAGLFVLWLNDRMEGSTGKRVAMRRGCRFRL